jgi:hypothetical protein
LIRRLVQTLFALAAALAGVAVARGMYGESVLLCIVAALIFAPAGWLLAGSLWRDSEGRPEGE